MKLIGETPCPCRCHTPEGKASGLRCSCWIPCCTHPYEQVQPGPPKRVYEMTDEPLGEGFKTFTFPQIEQPYPPLIAKDLVGDK